jgi:hypothetical protein
VVARFPAAASLKTTAAFAAGAEFPTQLAASVHNALLDPSHVWALAPRQHNPASAQANANEPVRRVRFSMVGFGRSGGVDFMVWVVVVVG